MLVERRTLRDYYIILRERVWIALPIAVLIALVFFFWEARKTPIYEAVASLQFEKPETVVTSQGVVDPSVRSDADLNTYIHDIDSNRLRASVIESFTPEESRILQRAALKHMPPGSNPPPVGSVLGSVSAQPLRNSYLICLLYTSRRTSSRATSAPAGSTCSIPSAGTPSGCRPSNICLLYTSRCV